MTYDAEQFDEALERLLDGADLAPGQEHDPLLVVARSLRDGFEPGTPEPAFRARLKAELLEKYADNVRPFPIAARLAEPAPVRPWQRTRRTIQALAVASAASIALAAGYGAVHHLSDSRQSPAALALPSATLPASTAVPRVTHSAYVPHPDHNSAAPRHPGNTDSVPAPFTPTVPRGPVIFPTTPPRFVAMNSTPTAHAVHPVAHATHWRPPHAGSTPAGTATPVDSATAERHVAARIQPTPVATTDSHVAMVIPPSATPSPKQAHVLPAATSTRIAPVPPTNTALPTRPRPTIAAPTMRRPTSTAHVVHIAQPAPTSTIPAPAATSTPRPKPSAAPPSSTPALHVAQARPTLARPSPVPPSATTVRHVAIAADTATPRPTQPAPSTSTKVPATSTKPAAPTATQPAPAATATSPAPTATPPAATATTVPTNTAPVTVAPSSTPAQTATSMPADTARPASTSTAPVPATATDQATLVAVVPATATAGGLSVAAAGPVGSATIAVPASSKFPALSRLSAGPGSPLQHTVPFTPGAALSMPAVFPPDPGPLAVYKPAESPQAPLDTLRAFALAPAKLLTQAHDHVSGIVASNNRFYRADFDQTTSGFHLKLTLVSAVPASMPKAPAFDAVSNARTFLSAHQLAGDGVQLDTVTVSVDGSRVAYFSEFAPDKIVGAHAILSFNARGVMTAVDMQWVYTSVAPLVPSISAAAALDGLAAGEGFIRTTGAMPDNTATITGTTILYLAVAAPEGTYYEPVYRFSGSTGSGTPFQAYISAIDRAYLR